MRLISEKEKNTILRVEDDIEVGQNVLYDEDMLYDEDEFNLDRAKEALLYGAYYDDRGYIIQGINILKEFIQNVTNFEEEDYNYFNSCINALQAIANKWLTK